MLGQWAPWTRRGAGKLSERGVIALQQAEGGGAKHSNVKGRVMAKVTPRERPPQNETQKLKGRADLSSFFFSIVIVLKSAMKMKDQRFKMWGS